MDKEEKVKRHEELVKKLIDLLEKKEEIVEGGRLKALEGINSEERAYINELEKIWSDSELKGLIEKDREQVELLKRLNEKINKVSEKLLLRIDKVKEELTKKSDIKSILEKIEPQRERKGYFIDKEG